MHRVIRHLRAGRPGDVTNEDGPAVRDQGAVLVMVLVLCIILSVVSVSLARYATTGLRSSRVTDQLNNRTASSDIGLRLGLEKLKELPRGCGLDFLDSVVNGATVDVDCTNIAATAPLTSKHTLLSTATLDGSSYSMAVVSLPTTTCPGAACIATVESWSTVDRAAVDQVRGAVTPPGSPTTLSASAGAGQVTISWAAPSANGGSVVTGYTATSNPDAKTCTTTGATTCTITGLTNGTSYTFTVTARNAVGDGTPSVPSPAVTPRTVPDPPSAVTAVAGNTQVTVSWSAPASTGGAPITGYTVTSSPDSKTCTTTSATTCTVTGLANGAAYTFSVVATNVVGSSQPAVSASYKPRTTPGAPTGVTAVPGDAQATVSWTAPSSNGGAPITGYTVSSTPIGASCTSSTTSCVVPGLTNGVSYTFTVTATNEAGAGPASTPPSAAVTPRTVPGAPTAVTGAAGNGQVTVSWTAPSSNGGAPITGYTVTASPGGATCTATGATTTSCTVTGLTNGTSYTFTVTATNVAGTSALSSPSAAVTPRTVPNAPTGATAVRGDGQATVSWTAPTFNGGAAITGYTATSSPDGKTCTTTGALTCTVTGLTNGTSYTFTIVATNAAGSGAASPPSGAVTPATVPDPPTNATVVPGNGAITVSWTIPAWNGGDAITGYTATSTSGGKTCSATGATATTCTVTGLTNGSQLAFTVVATNTVGNSAASAASASVIAGAPTAPTNVVATPGNAQVTLSWTASANNGSALTKYFVDWTSATTSGTASNCTTSTTCTVGSLTNGTAYSFTVRANNVRGDSPSSSPPVTATPVTAPGQPTGVVATPGNGQATVSWTAPVSNGGAAITSYTATAGSFTCTTSTTTCVLTGLTNGTSYTVTVKATNAAGLTSPASSPGVSVTPRTVPGAPTITAATPANGQVTLTWTAPTSTGGSAITGYGVSWTTGTSSGVPPCTSSPCVVTGLTNGTAYTFTVVAKNAAGDGPGSTLTATPRTTPGAPNSFNGSPTTNSISLTWAPPTSDGGAAITSYTVTSSPVTTTCTTATLSCNFTGLAANTSYTFTIKANNVAGAGTAATVTIKTGTPTAPNNVRADPTSSANATTEMVVTWTAPTSTNGSTLTGYIVTATASGQTNKTCTAGASGTTCTVSGLTASVAYTFGVAATSSNGNGASAYTPPVVAGAPDAPTLQTATTPGPPDTVTVTWAAPGNNGSAITGYTVTANDGTTCASSTTSCTFTTLTGSNYTFTVTATNGRGVGPPSLATSPAITPP